MSSEDDNNDSHVAEQDETAEERAQTKKFKVRGGHRAHLKKLLHEVDDLLKKESSSELELKVKATNASLIWKNELLLSLNDEIMENIEEEEEEEERILKEREHSEEYQRPIQFRMAKIQKFLRFNVFPKLAVLEGSVLIHFL